MKIGLPSALINPFYVSFWRTFFEELGLEVVESGQTTKMIIDKGIRYSVPEICVPIKIYAGHVKELLDQGVDYVYIPRMITIREGDTFCPKFLGLPDMERYAIPGLDEKIITHHIRSNTDDISTIDNYMEIGKRFTQDEGKIKSALEEARLKWRRFRELCIEGYNCHEANSIVLDGKRISKRNNSIKIGVIGYVYNVYDNFISMDILSRLESMGADTITFEMIDSSEVEKQLLKFRKSLFWTFSNKLMAGAYSFFEDESIDGVIHVTAFGCGPDSFLGKILEIDSTKYKKPFMTVRVDEHTGESHIQTRIEAFVDMIARKKQRREWA